MNRLMVWHVCGCGCVEDFRWLVTGLILSWYTFAYCLFSGASTILAWFHTHQNLQIYHMFLHCVQILEWNHTNTVETPEKRQKAKKQKKKKEKVYLLRIEPVISHLESPTQPQPHTHHTINLFICRYVCKYKHSWLLWNACDQKWGRVGSA